MPKASHAAQLREAILNCLAEGSPHSIAEIRASVAAQDPSLLSPGRRFSGVLYDWGKADPRLQHPKKGYYSYLAAPSSSSPTRHPLYDPSVHLLWPFGSFSSESVCIIHPDTPLSCLPVFFFCFSLYPPSHFLPFSLQSCFNCTSLSAASGYVYPSRMAFSAPEYLFQSSVLPSSAFLPSSVIR